LLSSDSGSSSISERENPPWYGPSSINDGDGQINTNRENRAGSRCDARTPIIALTVAVEDCVSDDAVAVVSTVRCRDGDPPPHPTTRQSKTADSRHTDVIGVRRDQEANANVITPLKLQLAVTCAGSKPCATNDVAAQEWITHDRR
jgi:hypothetical protein